MIAESTAPGFGATMPLAGWSMTKSLVNLVIGKLVSEGKLRRDQKALFDEWTDERKEITIDHLLQMSSSTEIRCRSRSH